MHETAKKALIRYLHPGHTYLILAIALILFSMVSISTIFIPILCVGCSALFIWLWSASNKKFKSDLAAAEQSGNLSNIASDFSESQPVLHNKIRLGQRCIYGRKCGRIVYYSDIRRFYVSTVKAYLHPSCELKSGELVDLCQLRASRYPNQYTTLLQIGNTIRSHNPSAAIDSL